jgi:hypothetical protein
VVQEKNISLAPLSPEDALRRAMQVPAPEHDPKPVKAAKRPAKKAGKGKKR